VAETFNSFTAPFTASGRAALVPPPPWHYAGWLINVAFQFDPSRAASFVPAALGRATGAGCIHFADWQATTDGSELLDPVYAQYRETIAIVEIERPGGERLNFCPFIWVDQDISLLRGLLQGWPKKLGSTWMTRSLPLDHPAASPLREGSPLGASLSVKDRRLVEARLRLTGRPGKALGFLANKVVGTVGWADLTRPDAMPAPRFVLPAISGKVASDWHEAEGTLTLLPHPVEELSLLGEIRVTAASAGWAGITVTGAADLEG
jgi:hypothetical protein